MQRVTKYALCLVLAMAFAAFPTVAGAAKVYHNLSGTVTGQFDNVPIPGATVTPFVLNNRGAWIAQPSTQTDALGRYNTTLLEGTYRIQFSATDYLTEYWNDVSIFESSTAVTLNQDLVCAPGLRPVEDGTSGRPYLVYDLNSLAAVGAQQNAVYSIVCDIDASATSDPASPWNNGGAGWAPLLPGGAFNGVLRGNGHTISNLYANRPSSGTLGLFERLAQATVSDLSFSNCTMLGGTQLNGTYVGALAGISDGVQLAVTNVDVESGQFLGYCSGSLMGMLGGYQGANVTLCDASASVEGYSAGGLFGNTNYGPWVRRSSFAGTVNGTTFAGGLVGSMHGTRIRDCYAKASVVGGNAGGFCGRMYNGISWWSDLQNGYFAGTISGSSAAGGLIGLPVDPRGTLDSCYYDSDLANVADNGFGIPKTTAEMYGSALYGNWDLTGVWSATETDYPTLR